MIEGRDRLGFTRKALGELFGGNFDGDVAMEASIGGLVDFAHTPTADRCQNLVRSQFCPDRKWHTDSTQFNRSTDGLWSQRHREAKDSRH